MSRNSFESARSVQQGGTAVADSQLRDEIGFFLAITSQLYQARISTLIAQHDISYSQFAVLNHLVGASTPASISELAEVMEINQPGVTKVVRRLDDLELVSISSDPSDSRRRLVSAKPKAGTLLTEIRKTLEADSQAWFEGWSQDELAAFRDRLAGLSGWLDANRLA